jgi:hypothetical protein
MCRLVKYASRKQLLTQLRIYEYNSVWFQGQAAQLEIIVIKSLSYSYLDILSPVTGRKKVAFRPNLTSVYIIT